MFCAKCGQSLQDDALFCYFCENKILLNASIQSTNPVTQSISQNGSSCYHHPTESATGACRRCSKAICSDCMEAFTPSSGMFEKQCLCYDCYSNIVQTNINNISYEKEQLLNYYNQLNFRMKIGAGIGAVMGLYASFLILLLPVAFIVKILLIPLCFSLVIINFAIFIGFFKEYMRLLFQSSKEAFYYATRTPDVYTNVATGLTKGCLMALTKPFHPLDHLILEYFSIKRQLEHYDNILDSENQSLQIARDQMNFWKLRNKNKNLDLSDLIFMEPSLQSNTYVQHLLGR